MTTKGRLAEQILRLYNGGDVSSDHSISLEEVMLLVTQAVNKSIKREYYETHYPLSERIPPRSAIATYEDLPVVAYGDTLTGIACTDIDTNGLYVYWDTGTGFWDTGDGFWTVILENVNVSITRVLSNNVYVYVVTLTGITYPNEFDAADVLAFITGCPAGGAIEFDGMTSGIPSVFISDGVNDVDVVGDTITFNYTPTDTTGASTPITELAAATHTQLAAITATSQWTTDLGNIRCCVDTDNTGTKRGKVTLPAHPINLPNGMGVWRIYSKETPDSPYIPVPTSLYGIGLGSTQNTLGASLAALTCYEVFNNKYILFNQLTASLPATVSMQLIVVDPDEIGEYDILPVPPEMEGEIIANVLQILGQTPPEDQSVDGNSTTR